MIEERFLPRVWDKDKKAMYYPVFSELGVTYESKEFPTKTIEELRNLDWAFSWRFTDDDIEYRNTLMQCTGLRDKNGKLIYEGDVVRYRDYTAVVEYGKSSPGIFDYQGVWVIDFDLNNEVSMLYAMHDQVEVIGNIHENKELIRGNNGRGI